MATEDDSEIPETGAIFTFGKSKFGDNIPSKFWIRDDKVHHIACGDEHTALVAESGKLFTFGSNDWGQLGLGHDRAVTKPSRVKALKSEKIKLVTCGRTHTIVSTESGKLYSFGNNGDGQLGIGSSGSSEQKQNKPRLVEGVDGINFKLLSAGNDHSVGVTDNGKVYVWGSNSDGQCGMGDTNEIITPTLLDIEDVVCVSCGYYHTAFVTASGKLLTCGEEEDGKLGLDADSPVLTPTHVQGIDGNVVFVACGGTHTIAITDDGRAYSFGKGANGQLGLGTKIQNASTPIEITTVTEKFKSASCGENHSALISKKGSLFMFGDGRHGKLALGEENFANQFRPTFVSRFENMCVESVSCGGCHTLASATLRLSNGHIVNGHEPTEMDEVDSPPIEARHKRLSQMDHIRESMDLEGSIGARNRRREKLTDPATSLNHRTLPPLNSSFAASGKQSLPPLSSTQQPPAVSQSYDSALKGRTLPIQRAHAAAVASAPPPEPVEEEDNEHSSDVSVTESEEETKDTSPKAVPQAKPRPVPRKPLDQQDEESESEEESEEDDELGALNKKPQTLKPLPAARLKKVSYEDQKLSPIVKREAPKVHSKGKLQQEESDDEDEESEEDTKQKSKKDDKKKKDKPSPRKKKSVGIFGKKKFDDDDDEEDSEEESEEEDSEEEVKKKEKDKKKKEKDKKNKKKGKDDSEEKNKKKKKEEEDKKKKNKKGKVEESEEESDEDDDDDEESEEEDIKGKNDKKKDEKADDKDKKDEKDKDKTEPAKPATQKKSGTCSIL